MKQSGSDRLLGGINIFFLCIIATVTIFPIYYIVIVSFTDPTEYLTRDFVLFPTKWSLTSYQYLLTTDDFPRAMGISALLALVGTPIHLITTSSLAYSLSRKRLIGRKYFLLLILFTMLFSPGLIPNYFMIRSFGLINSLWALILPGATSGFSVILMKSFFESIPETLEEAAVIDGCNDISIWYRIILPLSLPSLAAIGLFSAVGQWNTYMSALIYITDYKKFPLQVLLQSMLAQPAAATAADFIDVKPPEETLKMAAVVITTLPIVMVYPLLQKHFAKGVMLGSVKG